MARKDFSSIRKFPRRRYRRPCGILYKGDYWLCRTEDLGEGGLLIISPKTLPVGSTVIATIFVPGSGSMANVRGVVKYQNADSEGNHSIGLQFSNIEFKVKKSVRDYIAGKSEAEAEMDNMR